MCSVDIDQNFTFTTAIWCGIARFGAHIGSMFAFVTGRQFFITECVGLSHAIRMRHMVPLLWETLCYRNMYRHTALSSSLENGLGRVRWVARLYLNPTGRIATPQSLLFRPPYHYCLVKPGRPVLWQNHTGVHSCCKSV